MLHIRGKKRTVDYNQCFPGTEQYFPHVEKRREKNVWPHLIGSLQGYFRCCPALFLLLFLISARLMSTKWYFVMALISIAMATVRLNILSSLIGHLRWSQNCCWSLRAENQRLMNTILLRREAPSHSCGRSSGWPYWPQGSRPLLWAIQRKRGGEEGRRP